MSGRKKISIRILNRPGLQWSDEELRAGVEIFRDIGQDALGSVPEYKVFTGNRDFLKRCVIGLAYLNGQPVGFCSSVINTVPGVGEVFHIGLTCLKQSGRSLGLSSRLMFMVGAYYLLVHRKGRKTFITNLSNSPLALGQMGERMGGVFPFPTAPSSPPPEYLRIARYFVENIWDCVGGQIPGQEGLDFDSKNFVVRNSAGNTAFAKGEGLPAWALHRKSSVNDYFLQCLNYRRGDEMLQVGYGDVKTMIRTVGRKIIPWIHLRDQYSDGRQGTKLPPH